MSDLKQTETREAEALSDDQLAHASAGWSGVVTNWTTAFSTVGSPTVVSAAEEELMVLRRRPTRIEKDPLEGVEEAGVLRRRPTR